MMRVAFDTGPLHGPITGVGRAVEAMMSNATVDLVPYVLSFRAELREGTTRLPYPAAVALRLWGRFDHPCPDRHLGDVSVVHGTNYVVPPSRHHRLVTVYDCWALEHPDSRTRDVDLMFGAMRRAIDSGAHVHASSHATAERLRGHFPDAAITTIHLGPPSVPLVSEGSIGGLPDDGRVILAIGTLERRKNLPFLVATMDDVVGTVPDARLVIAGGDGDDSAAVRAVIDRLGNSARDRVHLLGRVDDVTLGRLRHRATVVAYPSLDEGFGFPLLEAMASDLPLVASNAGSIPEVAGDAALLCSPTEREHWIDSLIVALTDEDRRRELIERGRRRQTEFDWTRTARELQDLYRTLADGH